MYFNVEKLIFEVKVYGKLVFVVFIFYCFVNSCVWLCL